MIKGSMSDLGLLDMSYQKWTAGKFVSKVKTDESITQITMVAHTANALEVGRAQALAAVFDEYATNPNVMKS